MLAFTRLIDRRKAFPIHQLSPNVNPLNTVKRPVTCSTGQLHTGLLSVQSIHDLPQIPEHCLPTKYAHASCRSHKQCCSSPNVSFILISSSPDRTNFIRVLTGNVMVNVFKSDAVIWWAATFRRGAGERRGRREVRGTRG